MNKTRRPKTRIKLLGICLILVLSMCGLTFAAYVNQGYKKGVVAANRGAVRFSSDVLVLIPEGSAAASKSQPVTFGDAEIAETVSFTIYNHPYGNPIQTNNSDITYDLTFEIIGSGGAPKPTISFPGGEHAMTSDTYTLQKTLTGGAASSHTYAIHFPGASIGAYQLLVTAVPANISSKKATDRNMLSCLYVPVLVTEAQSSETIASGEFIDPRASNLPSEYHAFNYRLTLQNFEGDVVLTWDDTLQPDPFFIEMMEAEAGAVLTNRTLSFSSTEEMAGYEFIFYRTEVPFTDADSWTELDAAVTLTANPA